MCHYPGSMGGWVVLGNAHLCRDCGILILLASGEHLPAGRAEARTLLPRGCSPAGDPVFLLLKPSWRRVFLGAEAVSTALLCDFFESGWSLLLRRQEVVGQSGDEVDGWS